MLSGVSLSFDIKVNDAEKKNSSENGSSYDVYPVEITHMSTGTVHRVDRRFSEFLEFYNDIKGAPELEKYVFPGKTVLVISKVNEKTKEKRKAAFQNLLTIIFTMDPLPYTVGDFLEVHNAPLSIRDVLTQHLEPPRTSRNGNKRDKNHSSSLLLPIKKPDTPPSSGAGTLMSPDLGADDVAQSLLAKPMFNRMRPAKGRNTVKKHAQADTTSTTSPTNSTDGAAETAERDGSPSTVSEEAKSGLAAAVEEMSFFNPAPMGGSSTSPGGAPLPLRIKPKGRRPSLSQKLAFNAVDPNPTAGPSDPVPHEVMTRAPGAGRWVPSSSAEWALQAFNLSKTPRTPRDGTSTTEVIEWLVKEPQLNKTQVVLYLSSSEHQSILRGMAAHACRGASFMEALATFAQQSGLGSLELSHEHLITLLAAFAKEQTMCESALRSSGMWHEVADLAYCTLELHQRVHVANTHSASAVLFQMFCSDVRATTVPPADPISTFPNALLESVYGPTVMGVLKEHERPRAMDFLLQTAILRADMKVVLGNTAVPTKMFVVLNHDGLYFCYPDVPDKPAYVVALQTVSPDCPDDEDMCSILLTSFGNGVAAGGGHDQCMTLMAYPGKASRLVQHVLLRLSSNDQMERWLDALRHWTWVVRRGVNSAAASLPM
jgi:hypothetical protein